MPRTKKTPTDVVPTTGLNGTPPEVMTLAEAAAYLRFTEADVLRLIKEQGLPARVHGTQWRLARAAIQRWLSTPMSKVGNEGIWAMAGSWKEDPYLDEMLEEIYRKRGRPMTEE